MQNSRAVIKALDLMTCDEVMVDPDDPRCLLFGLGDPEGGPQKHPAVLVDVEFKAAILGGTGAAAMAMAGFMNHMQMTGLGLRLLEAEAALLAILDPSVEVEDAEEGWRLNEELLAKRFTAWGCFR